MSTDASALIVPGHGTLFTADGTAELPSDPKSAFTLTGSVPDGWDRIGHTSKQNLPAFSRDGGEASKLDTWLVDGVRTIYSATNWGLGFASVQIDRASLDMAFGGDFDDDGGYIVPGANTGIQKQLYLLAADGTGTLGFYMPSTSIALGDVPSFDVENFLELPLSASIQGDSDKIPSVNGVPGIMKIYKSGLVQLVTPAVTAAAPSGAAAGATVTVTGTGFLGASAVRFGSANAASFSVLSDTQLTAVVPAGAAGSAAIKVINAVGESNSLAYTRG